MARWLLGLALAVDLALMVILCQPITAPMVYEQTVKEEVAVVEQGQKKPGIHQDLREAMEAYNLQLSQDQSGLDSVDSYEAPGLNLEDYGMEADDAVGYVEIPAMDVTLPLYLGASRAHMNDGAAVLGQTSMPIGGIATNCVIAAHRGWNGKAMFRDVELLQEGDLVYLTNLWETLTYQVTGISIIWPDEVEAVAIQPGQDMVTLLTCHPYIVGTYRYLVYCQRVKDEAPIQPTTTTTPDVQQEQAEVSHKKIRPFIIPIVVTLVVLVLFHSIFMLGYVPTESMEPTLETGSLILGLRIFDELETGDIIIFRRDGSYLVKRIAACAGDTIDHQNSIVTVPDNCYYVLGDNAENSHDSRYWADPYVSHEDVIAKLLMPIK